MNLLIDFDSTFIKTETLDELAQLKQCDAALVQRIISLTNAAMEGQLSFNEALNQRISLLSPTRNECDALTAILKTQVTDSILAAKSWIQANNQHIYVLSGGFFEMIVPIVADFHINPQHVLANTLAFTGDKCIGVDQANPLAHNQGKVTCVQQLNLPGKIIMLGDGSTDLEVKAAGDHVSFYVFTENVRRDAVVKHANKVIPNFQTLIHHLGETL